MKFLLFSRLREAVQLPLFALACLGTHELGHAVAGWLVGQHVSEFVVLSLRPHVCLVGPTTAAQEAFIAVAGTALILLGWFAMLLWKRTRGFWTTDLLSGFALVELLGWTLSSLMPPGGPSPDDAEWFSTASGASPDVVAAVCVFLAFSGCLLWLRPVRKSEEARACHFMSAGGADA